jgi:hypothetical protein
VNAEEATHKSGGSQPPPPVYQQRHQQANTTQMNADVDQVIASRLQLSETEIEGVAEDDKRSIHLTARVA